MNTKATLTYEQLKRFPKIELHQHLEGSITAAMILDFDAKHRFNIHSRHYETLHNAIVYSSSKPSLTDFLSKFTVIEKLFTSADIITDLTMGVLGAAQEENVIHLELRYSPAYIAQTAKLSWDLVTEAVVKAVDDFTKKATMTVSLIVIVERCNGIKEANSIIDHAINWKNNGISAVDLANDESTHPPAPFAPCFQRAKRENLHITIHAGEVPSPENIATAIGELGAERIGHGIYLYLDQKTYQLVQETQTLLELCLTSNVLTGAVDLQTTYPGRRFFDDRIPISYCTDDPAICGVTHTDELYKVMQHQGYAAAELKEILLSAAQHTFLKQDGRQALLQRIAKETSRQSKSF